MNERGLSRCVEEQEGVAAELADLTAHCDDLEEVFARYDVHLQHVMASHAELAHENEELRAHLADYSSVTALVAEVESLRKDKEYLRINLRRAEEEVKALFEENNIMDEENKKLLKKLKRDRHHQGSGNKNSASTSAKGKRKSTWEE